MCSFEDFTVLNYESHKFKRLIKECLLVIKDKPLLNKQVKSLKLELLIQFHLRYFIILRFNTRHTSRLSHVNVFLSHYGGQLNSGRAGGGRKDRL